MINKKLYACLIVILLFNVFLYAGEIRIRESSLTLDECISIALQKNPLMLSFLQKHQASIARINQAKALPQPIISYDSDLQPKFFSFKDSGESYFGINQLIEFPGKRSLRGKIAVKESDELIADIETLKLDLIYQVKRAFYGLLLAQEKEKYARQNLRLSQDFLEKAEIKYEAGDVAKVEVLRAKVEKAKAENEVKVTINEDKLAKAQLNFLLAREKYEPLEIKGYLKKPFVRLVFDDLKEKAFQFRPEIRRTNFSLEREILIKKQSYLGYLPDFDLGISKHRIKGENETWDITLSFPIPLFFWQPKKGEIAEAKANIESLKAELKHFKNLISLEVEDAYINAVALENQIKLFEDEILKQAEEVYNMSIFSYQEGEIGSIELIESRRTLIEAKKSYADALFNHNVALAELEKSIGKNISFNIERSMNKEGKK